MTTWNEWAHAPDPQNPAVISRDWKVIDAEKDGNRSAGTYYNGLSDALNQEQTYPVRTDPLALPDEWHEPDPTQDTIALVAADDGQPGQMYKRTLGVKQMDYQTAKTQARQILGAYYVEYSQSVFQAAQNWFPASADATGRYMVIDADYNRDANASHVVLDVDDLPHRVNNATEWGQFWSKYMVLFKDAANITENAWTQVRNATTTDEVKAIIDALPPVPTVP